MSAAAIFLFLFSFALSVEGSSSDYRLRKVGDDMLLKCVNTGSQNGNCYILENDTEALILDAGVRYNDVLKALDYNISKVAGVLLTHEHGDHIKCFKDLIRAGIKCYGSDELQESLRTITGELITGLQEKKAYRIGNFSVIPMKVPHDGTDCVAYIIEFGEEKLLYATDFSYLPYRLTSWKINHWLIECNHIQDLVDKSEAKYEHSIRGHSELSTVKEIISVNKTPEMRNIILCHLSEGWSDEKRMKVEIQETAGKWVRVEVAHAGLELPLSRYPWE